MWGVPVLTNVHTAEQCAVVSKHVDVLQIPAFLCRQTDLLIAAAKTGKVINVKKGQFLAPWDMINVTKKNCRFRKYKYFSYRERSKFWLQYFSVRHEIVAYHGKKWLSSSF